jgi:trehalose 6-phosphate phosphatase
MARPLADADLDPLVRARPLVLLFDIDGTLAPIVAHPDEARIPDDTQRILTTLAAAPDVHVGFVTGRSAASARRIVDVPGAWVIGNHGAESADGQGTVTVHPEVAAFVPALRGAVGELTDALVGVPGVLIEDKALSLSIHYRNVARDRVAEVTALVDDVARRRGLVRRDGKEVLELRAPVAVDKGTAIRALAARLGAASPDAITLFAGDDVTDEDAFVALRDHAAGACTIRVGEPDAPTAARFVVPHPAALRDVLAWIAERRAAG